MKKILYILTLVVLCTGCHVLDFDETSADYTRADMITDYSNISRLLTNVYGYMPAKDIADVSSALRDCGSDDAEYADPEASVQRFTNGNWSSISTVDTKWELYGGVRAANDFLDLVWDEETKDIKEVVKENLSIFRYTSKYNQQMEHLACFPYEAKVLRAYYFFELARRYGDIPMPLVKLTAEEANAIEKTPFDDVVEFIVAECDEAAEHLPNTYVGMLDDEIGRVTKGFALAVKAKALLYAASPLHNPSGDKAKWEKAAAAAKAIMDMDYYVLDPKETANNYTSPEVILAICRSESQSFERYNFPVRFTYGDRTSMAGTYPTQNLVDAFQTINGYDITLGANGWTTSDPDFDITRPYENRDPRFARAILANGMAFKGSTIETFVGGRDYSATRSDLGTVTGYYLRRYIIESVDFTPEAQVQAKHQWIVYRYAEALLSYAEALNEYLGSPTATDGTFTVSALDALNQVRANAMMPAVRASSQAAFRDAVRREWRVEFAFEDHRFWDVRRWDIGQETQGQIDGVEIVKSGSQFTYSRKVVETRSWSSRMNLFPIPQSETFSNPNLTQNTGW
ncbi:MAG: RagB/SusD family nutrient uptake outer membrane protein [Bacteroidales bacterium]|nr:RagB/SusD family nutrient uptake outer membrane protein [Bacteroidales bacterium]